MVIPDEQLQVIIEVVVRHYGISLLLFTHKRKYPVGVLILLTAVILEQQPSAMVGGWGCHEIGLHSLLIVVFERFIIAIVVLAGHM
jgi:hypothetical protein